MSQQFFQNTLIDSLYIHSNTFDNNPIFFKAYITKLDDSRVSSWTSTDIYGHMDPVYSFKNTVRKMTLAFSIPSFNVEDAIQNYNKLKALKQSLYPIYNLHQDSRFPANEQKPDSKSMVLSTPPVHFIRYANLIKAPVDTKVTNDALIGWINKIDFTPSMEDGFYLNKFDSITENSIFAKLFKLSFSFNVIHHYPVGFYMKNQIITKRYLNITKENNLREENSTLISQNEEPDSPLLASMSDSDSQLG